MLHWIIISRIRIFHKYISIYTNYCLLVCLEMYATTPEDNANYVESMKNCLVLFIFCISAKSKALFIHISTILYLLDMHERKLTFWAPCMRKYSKCEWSTTFSFMLKHTPSPGVSSMVIIIYTSNPSWILGYTKKRKNVASLCNIQSIECILFANAISLRSNIGMMDAHFYLLVCLIMMLKMLRTL